MTYFYNEKISRRIEEIAGTVYRKELPITSFKIKEGKEPGNERADTDDGSWTDFSTENAWGGFGKYQWFRTRLVIPEEFNGERIVFRLDSPGDTVWKDSAEYTVYVDGKLNQGLDIFHHELFLAEEAKPGRAYDIAILGFNALVDKRTVTEAKLAAIDRTAEEYYFNLKTAFDSALLMEQSPGYFAVADAINNSVNLIDFRVPRSGEYYQSLKTANDYLVKNLYQKMGGRSDVVIDAVGHTHIDVAWLWQLSHTKEKSARSFSTAVKLMDLYPDYIFMQSQPQLYAFIKESYPELYEKIKKRVTEGRWEPEGGMWVEADCNLISGESMIRQFLVGKAFFRDEFGVDSKILWLPDVFGYSAAMPQILKKCGVNYFLTTKISWNQFNRMPADTFFLKGIDGTKVLTHFMTTPELRSDFIHELPYKKTYNGEMCPAAAVKSWEAYAQKDLNNELIMAFGYGDGGGGPSKEMLETAKRLKNFPGIPNVRMRFPSEYFADLEKRLEGKKVPEWAGELYLEYHRGTYTSMARNKKFNRQSEFLYLNIESFSVMAELLGFPYPREQLEKNWKLILLNQFHDILPGSSIGAVYEDSRNQYEAVLSEGARLLDAALTGIVKNIQSEKDALAVFNPASNRAGGLVTFREVLNASALAAPDGALSPVQRLDDGTSVFFAPQVPSKGYALYTKAEKSAAVADIKVEPGRMENRFFIITLDKKGTLTSIFDKRNKREVLAPGERGNVLLSFEDKPINFNAWDIEAYYTEKVWEIDDLSSIEITDQGPVLGGLRITRRYLRSVIRQDIVIYNDVGRIDFKTEIDWHEQEILLKASFPVDINAVKAVYEIQYGNIERNTHENTSWDTAKFEVSMHKWLDVSEGDYGVSLLNDCKYGGDVHGNVIRLTLLKSGINPFPDADKEIHRFTYSLYPHAGNWRDGGTIPQAYALNNPLIAKTVPAQKGSLPAEYSFVSVDNKNVIIEAVKKAESGEGYIIRAYESGNTRGEAVLCFARNLKSVSQCSMLETEEESLEPLQNTVKARFKPFEIKTLKVLFAD
jgi:alpha-mannosidase